MSWQCLLASSSVGLAWVQSRSCNRLVGLVRGWCYRAVTLICLAVDTGFRLVLTLKQGAGMTGATCLHQDSLSSLTWLVLGFQRAAREGKPQCTAFFKSFLSLHLLTASLAKLCQMTKSRVIIWQSLQGHGYKEAWINQGHPCKIYPKSIKFYSSEIDEQYYGISVIL